MSQVLVTGGCGYKGSVLVPKLIAAGHSVRVIDSCWFGNYLPRHPNLEVLKKDIRDLSSADVSGFDTVIHLANIANDPSVELNQTLSWEVNVLATYNLLDLSKRSGVQHFLFASSGSVYGVKAEPNVTEDLPLVPISAYNKTKMVAERVCLSYRDDFIIHNLRPATVCGMSPRMRLDVAVNLLTFQALSKGTITVLGGNQVRPNIHVKDIASLYIFMMNNKDLIPSGCYNAGFENISILDIASKISERIHCSVNIVESNDPRSYRQDSSLIKSFGFLPEYSVDHAIDELIASFKSGQLSDNPDWHTVATMKAKSIA